MCMQLSVVRQTAQYICLVSYKSFYFLLELNDFYLRTLQYDKIVIQCLGMFFEIPSNVRQHFLIYEKDGSCFDVIKRGERHNDLYYTYLIASNWNVIKIFTSTSYSLNVLR